MWLEDLLKIVHQHLHYNMKNKIIIFLITLIPVIGFSQVREPAKVNEFKVSLTGDMLYITDSTLSLRGGLIPVAILESGEARIGSSSRSYLSPSGHAYKIEGNKVVCKKSGVLTVNHNYIVGKTYYLQFEGTYDTIPMYPFITPCFFVLNTTTLFIKESKSEQLGSVGKLAEYRPFNGILNYLPSDTYLKINWTPGHDSVTVYESGGLIDSIIYNKNLNKIESWTTNPANRNVSLETDGEGRNYLKFGVGTGQGALSTNEGLNEGLDTAFTIIAEFVPEDNSAENFWISREESLATGIGVLSTDLNALRGVYENGQSPFSPPISVTFDGNTKYIFALIYEDNQYRLYFKNDSNEYIKTFSADPQNSWNTLNIGAKNFGTSSFYDGSVYSFYAINRPLNKTEALKVLNEYEKYK